MPTKASPSDHDPVGRDLQGQTNVLGACVHRNVSLAHGRTFGRGGLADRAKPGSASPRGAGPSGWRRWVRCRASIASGHHRIDHGALPGCRRNGAASLYGNDGPPAVVECGRDVGGEARIEGHLELATEIVDAVPDGALMAEDNGLDLQDVGAHGTTIAEDAMAMH